MNMNLIKSRPGALALLAGLLFAGGIAAQELPSECVERGAVAFDNWTKMDSGGSGLPAGVANKDYIRCKSCHGWDRRGTDGGYVRRSRKNSRPNAGAGDGDSTLRTIVTGAVSAEQIQHSGSGRSYADGTGSWVELNDMMMHSAGNSGAHAGGYTLGNQHPDFSDGGPNGGDTRPTTDQVDCLVEFLNFADGDPSVYFADINPSQNPVLYTMVETADAGAGEMFYGDTCEGCHEAPEDFLLGYLEGDGKFSELAHKARWGSPDSEMTRENMGDPSAQNIADMMLYLQQLGGTGFAMNPGLNGLWWNTNRGGEGFQLEFSATEGGGLLLVSTFYTFDAMRNQVWFIAVGDVNGNEANVEVFIAEGAKWGEDFDPLDIVETPWGTGIFTGLSCGEIDVVMMPNADSQAMGYTTLTETLNPLTTSAVACPSAPLN